MARSQCLLANRDVWLCATLGVAAAAAMILSRILPVSTHDFALNDGGLFYAMTKDLWASSFQLPYFTSYNHAQIPFAYPPAAFFIGAMACQLGISIDFFFRFFPAACCCLLPFPVYLLARQCNCSRIACWSAVFAFACNRRAFEWQLMGGGVTRSLGLLCAATSVALFLRYFSVRSFMNLVYSSVCFALASLSHPEAGIFALAGVSAFCISRLRSRFDAFGLLLFSALSSILLMPWLAIIIHRHGFQKLFELFYSVPKLSEADLGTVIEFFEWRLSASIFEPYLPLQAYFAVIGISIAVKTRNFFPLFWWFSESALPGRANEAFAAVPLSILLGMGISTTLNVLHVESRIMNFRLINYFRILCAFILAVTSCWRIRTASDFYFSVPLTVRRDLQWIKTEVPTTDRFMVLEKAAWSWAAISEWFPALTDHANVTTIQGSEWLGPARMRELIARYSRMQNCGDLGVVCFDELVTRFQLTVDYLYVPHAQRPAFQKLLAGLLARPNVSVVRASQGGLIIRLH